jgi:hypothetical protein
MKLNLQHMRYNLASRAKPLAAPQTPHLTGARIELILSLNYLVIAVCLSRLIRALDG